VSPCNYYPSFASKYNIIYMYLFVTDVFSNIYYCFFAMLVCGDVDDDFI
jgi:hypothetical protein